MKQKMFKKTALLLALVLVISSALTGCGQSDGEGNTPPPANSGAASETPTTNQSAPDETEGSEHTALPENSGTLSEADEGAKAPATDAPEPSADASNANVPTTAPAPGMDPSNTDTPAAPTPVPTPTPTPEPDNASAGTTLSGATLEVRFGDDGVPFTLYLYDNDTAAAIAGHVGTADWRLPIYHYDDYTNWEIMQYYDIPSRYDIPSNPESVTAVKAGAVYYSEPNRIILFYGDGQVSSEYTPVGYIDYSQDFVDAVENNPVIEGWGNKIVNISD